MRFIIFAFFLWQIFINLVAFAAKQYVPLKERFLGPSIWANFDGFHYLLIARRDYVQYEQAFFPLYPRLIKQISIFFGGNYLYSGLFISNACFLVALVLFYKLVRLDFNKRVAKKSTIFLLLFPTSFFFASAYSESLFLVLVLASFYAARKKNWWLAGILGGFASATRLAGLILLPALFLEWLTVNKEKKFKSFINRIKGLLWLALIPTGILIYMLYLSKSTGDPLFFIHAQPAFGASRSGGEIILLYQVIWRYLKIFTSVPIAAYEFWIALLEFFSCLIFLILAIIPFLKPSKLRKSYGLFSILIILLPTLTGTFSSMPRYVLPAFSVFILLGGIKNKCINFIILLCFFALLVILTSLFTRGWWVA